jgi:hypothetical protein
MLTPVASLAPVFHLKSHKCSVGFGAPADRLAERDVVLLTKVPPADSLTIELFFGVSSGWFPPSSSHPGRQK